MMNYSPAAPLVLRLPLTLYLLPPAHILDSPCLARLLSVVQTPTPELSELLVTIHFSGRLLYLPLYRAGYNWA